VSAKRTPKWLAVLLPRTSRHRASCIAAYVPVLAYAAASAIRFRGLETERFWQSAFAASFTLAGPFYPCLCLITVLPEPLAFALVFALPLVPYFVIARHDVGTMPWPWWLALSTAWACFCWWTTTLWSKSGWR
jgi:hypothetical protein